MDQYLTKSNTVPPSAGVPFIAVDEGNASPKFIRSTLTHVPSNGNTLKTSGLPFGILIQPMADIGDGEEEVPTASTESEGPFRCKTCGTYINPGF